MVYRYNPDMQHELLSINQFEIHASITSEWIKALQKETQMDIDFINERMAYYYNQHHGKEPELKKGDKVYLLQKNIQTDRPNQKLDFKKLGPYKVVTKKNRLNYEIEIPDNKNFFNVFHISLLEPAPKDVRLTTTIQPNIINPDDNNDNDQEWEIQKILDSWYNDSLLQYQIHWKGYDIKDATWEPTENCKGSTTTLRKFHHSNPNKPR